MDASTSPSTRPLYRGTQIVWYAFGIVEVLLGFRFVLKLLGANPGAGFTDFITKRSERKESLLSFPSAVPVKSVLTPVIYGVTNVLVVPFSIVFGWPVLNRSGGGDGGPNSGSNTEDQGTTINVPDTVDVNVQEI